MHLSCFSVWGEVKVEIGQGGGKAEKGKGNIFQWLSSTPLGRKNYREAKNTNIRM